MAWITVGLEVMGETQVARQLELAEEWSHDLSEPLGQLMDDLLESVEAQFDSEGAAAEGIPWQRLSDTYGPWKAEHYPGAPILVRDGAMKAAMLTPSSTTVGPEEAIYEPQSDIAGYHQIGPRDWMGPSWGHRIGGGFGRPYTLSNHHPAPRRGGGPP